ncbi:MAG: RluA family pseudouridine synthase [Bacteroidales bacterium]|nr:RluA family pseudouridine synthase [Bacteroidales bacterium]
MYYRQLTEEEFNDLQSRILYEDNHILVVNKLSGEITQGDKTGDECLADSYKAFIARRDNKPGQVFLGIPHRLDRPVSGICVLAKTSKALGRLGVMLRDSGLHKVYWALCCSKPEPAEGHLEDWLIKNEAKNKSFVTTDRPGAKLAKLNYRWLRSTDRYHLLEVELLTGRHHQIRCQLSHIGCPIKGDLKYGAPRSNPDGGICLHAREVRFDHPVKHTEVHIIAPPPATWPL